MRGTTVITLTSILSRQGRGGIRTNLGRNPLSLGLYFIAALAVAVAVACGSEPAPPPPTPTAVSIAAPTATPPATSVEQSTDRGMAPNFSLPSAGGNEVALSGLLEDHKAVVLVFYRGYF